MKNDISALTDQLADVLNSFAGIAKKQARKGYKQARANANSAIDDYAGRGSAIMDDFSERGSAMMNAAQDVAYSMEESLEEAISQRPFATVGIALGIGILIGAAWRR